MVMALCVPAFAEGETPTPSELASGEVGGYETNAPDTPLTTITKAVNIQKEITAYNPTAKYVYGPEISYSYTIASATGSELVQITDETTDHSSGVATVVASALGDSDIQAGNPSLTGTEANKIVWTNADILETTNNGKANIKNLKVDFSSVIFKKPGVYRYKITETATYDNTGVTEGAISNIRFLDVYVMRSNDFNPTHDGTSGKEYVVGDWYIYGYVCISQESVENNAGGTTAVTPSTTKTSGFVADGTNTADAYYTYNFTVTNDLVGDNTMIGHQFPLTVAFTDGPTGTFQLIAETDATYSSLTTETVTTGAATVNGNQTTVDLKKVGSAVALTAFANAGNPKVADGNTTTGTTTGYITYIGIPNTTVVTVTEQNDNIGSTYTATVKEDDTTDNGSALAAVPVSDTNGTAASGNTSASIDNTETASRKAAYSGSAGTLAKNVQIQFTNTLSLISPTGVTLRYAPYMAMLGAGIVALPLSLRKKEEELY